MKLIFVCCLAPVALLSGGRSEPPAASVGGVDAPYAVITGPDCAMSQRRVSRITDRVAWREVWQRHLGKPVADPYVTIVGLPQINFRACMVVALFAGESLNSRGAYGVSWHEDADRARLRFTDMSYNTTGPDRSCRPFAFFVVPRSTKRLIVEESIVRERGEPPEMVRWARFAPLEKR